MLPPDNRHAGNCRMAMEQPDCPVAQGKAVKMYRNVENPLEVYPGMNSTVLDYQNIMGFLVLLFCVVIAAPVFSADYQSGADDILRCTRYGRVTLGIAKLFAALLISTAAFVIMALQHSARQRNRHSGERALRNYGLPVFESGRVVRLDAVCHDWGLHD